MSDKQEKRDFIQKEAVQAILKSNYNGIVMMAPRVGKTRTVIEALKSFIVKGGASPTTPILWVVPLRDNVDSTLAEINKWAPIIARSIRVETTRFLATHSSNHYPLIVASECHTLSSNMRENMARMARRFILESGTISEGKLELITRDLVVSLIYDYTIEEAILDDIISEYKIYVVGCNLDDNLRTLKIKNGGSVTEKRQYSYLTRLFIEAKNRAKQDPRLHELKMNRARLRSDFIYKAPTKIGLARKIINCIPRCLVFTTRTDVIDQLTSVSIHSKRKTLKTKSQILADFKSGETKKLGLCQTAFMSQTYPDLKDIVLHQIDSNEERLIQKAFRACNKEGDRVARVFICCYNNTKDEQWVNSALKGINPERIEYTTYEKLLEEGILEIPRKKKVPQTKV